MQKIIIIYVGEVCNNDCMMCSVKGHQRDAFDFDKLSSKIVKRKKHATEISFTGGEPTEHPHIIKLLRTAQESGYKKISLSTNGRRLADNHFLEKLIDSGLDEVSIAVHGPKDIHNEIVQKRAFREALQGVKNSLENNLIVTVDSVTMSKNIAHLDKLWSMILKLGVEYIGLQDLVPNKDADFDYDELLVSYERKRAFFYDNLNLLKKFKQVHITNFPRCVLPTTLCQNFIYTSNYEKESSWKFDGLSNSGTSKLKEKIKICNNCRYEKQCYGFRKENLKKFGKRSVEKMMTIDSSLSKK